MSKVKLNYLLDLVIGLAFLLSGLTGIAFLVMGDGGYQGGRNLSFQVAFLGISRAVWSDLHTLTSLVMIAGIVVHVVFHWDWIVCMTRKFMPKLPEFRKQKEQQCEVIA